MKEYIETRVKIYEIALEKIQELIEECGKNDLWDIVEHLEKGKFELIEFINEDKRRIQKES